MSRGRTDPDKEQCVSVPSDSFLITLQVLSQSPTRTLLEVALSDRIERGRPCLLNIPLSFFIGGFDSPGV